MRKYFLFYCSEQRILRALAKLMTLLRKILFVYYYFNVVPTLVNTLFQLSIFCRDINSTFSTLEQSDCISFLFQNKMIRIIFENVIRLNLSSMYLIWNLKGSQKLYRKHNLILKKIDFSFNKGEKRQTL